MATELVLVVLHVLQELLPQPLPPRLRKTHRLRPAAALRSNPALEVPLQVPPRPGLLLHGLVHVQPNPIHGVPHGAQAGTEVLGQCIAPVLQGLALLLRALQTIPALLHPRRQCGHVTLQTGNHPLQGGDLGDHRLQVGLIDGGGVLLQALSQVGELLVSFGQPPSQLTIVNPPRRPVVQLLEGSLLLLAGVGLLRQARVQVFQGVRGLLHHVGASLLILVQLGLELLHLLLPDVPVLVDRC
mmetsp:Transcript_17969/g.39679  ORF Transcript_17969/g.39679 Transcript_17969/m.39679 type:complete len:242 (+) Transcript_17969:1019-1744(+)